MLKYVISKITRGRRSPFELTFQPLSWRFHAS